MFFKHLLSTCSLKAYSHTSMDASTRRHSQPYRSGNITVIS